MIIGCASCRTLNRVPEERLGEDPKCGKCKAPLADGTPVAVDEASFDAAAARYGIRSIPTMVGFHGGREAARISGALDAASIASWTLQNLIIPAARRQ